jgi:hypothetical protein
MALAFRLPQPVTEEVVIALGRANPQHKIETTADGQIVMTPPTGTRSNFGELELARQVAHWNAIHKLGRRHAPERRDQVAGLRLRLACALERDLCG